MVDITPYAQWVAIIEGIATVAVVFFLWKAIKQMDESVKVSRFQLQHRFRPWIGPSSDIQLMRKDGGKEQFAIRLRNYGELAAANVKATFTMKNEKPTRDILKSSDGLDTFNLGPLLPNMEKSYWFFVDSDLMKKAKENSTQIYVAMYFGYEFPEGRSGYGMISHLDANTNSFVHTDMWAD